MSAFCFSERNLIEMHIEQVEENFLSTIFERTAQGQGSFREVIESFDRVPVVDNLTIAFEMLVLQE